MRACDVGLAVNPEPRWEHSPEYDRQDAAHSFGLEIAEAFQKHRAELLKLAARAEAQGLDDFADSLKGDAEMAESSADHYAEYY